MCYVFGKAFPGKMYVDRELVEAPNLGVKIGLPMFPDINKTYGVALVDLMRDQKECDDDTKKDAY